MKKSKAMALVAAGLVAGLVLGTVGISYAATTTATQGLGMGMGQSIRGAGARLVDIVAQLTGLTVDEVRAEREAGESIAAIAEANGVSSDAVVDRALAARSAILDEKVAAGTITQEQADAAYAQMSARVAERVTTAAAGAPSWAGSGNGRGMNGSGACGGACTVTQ